jgi:hypothetical protein
MDDAGPRSRATQRRAPRRPDLRSARRGARHSARPVPARPAYVGPRTEAGGKLRDALGANVFARDIYALVTYGRLGATLRTPGSAEAVQEPLPALGDEPLGVSEETLRVVEALAERRSAQIKDVRGETLVMGDFWPGNVLVGVEGGRWPDARRRLGDRQAGAGGGGRRPVLRRAGDAAAPAPRSRRSGRRGTEELCACVLCGRRWARGGRDAESGVGPLWRAPCRLDAEGRMECGSASEAWSGDGRREVPCRGGRPR